MKENPSLQLQVVLIIYIVVLQKICSSELFNT